MNKIKYSWAKPTLSSLEKKYVTDALDSTWISGGPYVERFESEFEQAIKAPHIVTTSNGTTALLLAYLALGISSGDEVIIPGFSFVSPANMAITLGARPVFVDVDPDSWCLDPAKVEKAITKKTKAICAVHTYGNVCDMKPLREICRKHHLFLIEDTAEAVFSRYNGQYAGTFSDAGAFSFQATKTITMGEGGCVAIRDKKLSARMKMIRSHGMNRKRIYWHSVIGHNFRLSNLQAAIGCAQLERVDQIIAQKKRVYDLYCQHLKNIPGITMQEFKKPVLPVVWAVAVKLNPKAFKGNRQGIREHMLQAGIETRPAFYPFQTMPLYRDFVKDQLPVARDIGANVLSLPSFVQLKAEEIAYICKTLLSTKKK
jgi:perosamine synthetase